MSKSKKDNKFSGARNLGDWDNRLNQKGFVGRKDKVDFYTFSVLGRSSATTTLKMPFSNQPKRTPFM
ncbi:MAG: hypothetical protein VKJ64_13315 [Leptolyngbyaceae bacterium]|nr:hypothetical protein [Leptolyngbyaceae bacterium]